MASARCSCAATPGRRCAPRARSRACSRAVAIGKAHYVDGVGQPGGPVDAARELGADFVIAVDIGSKADGIASPASMVGNVNQSIKIMGQKLGAQELARADIVIRPKVNDIGAADFAQRNRAIWNMSAPRRTALPARSARDWPPCAMPRQRANRRPTRASAGRASAPTPRSRAGIQTRAAPRLRTPAAADR